jgi:hypothetical protein
MPEVKSRFLPYSAEDFAGGASCGSSQTVARQWVTSRSTRLGERLLAMERRPAAVLVPVIHREPEATVLFTQRTTGLAGACGADRLSRRSHRPAKTRAPKPPPCARRKRRSGLTADHVETLLPGAGLPYRVRLPRRAGRGDRPAGISLSLNPAEVADVFEVPLSFLMNPANHHHSSRVWDGAKRFFFTMPYGERHIWGITAGIVRILYQRLYADVAVDVPA